MAYGETVALEVAKWYRMPCTMDPFCWMEVALALAVGSTEGEV